MFFHILWLFLVPCYSYMVKRGQHFATNLNGYSFLRPHKVRAKEFSYDIASKSPAPCIILVGPELDMNVGSVARSMLNFGLHDLRIVNPQCNVVSGAARALAAGADKVLENAKIYSTLHSCITDLRCVLATTVRPRDMNYRILTPEYAAECAVNTSSGSSVGIVFGRESDGLTNEEIELADAVVSIPTFPHFASLNLAQSVNIVCYELWKHRAEKEQNAQPPDFVHLKGEELPATHESLSKFISRVEQYLEILKYRNWNYEMKSRFLTGIRLIIRRAQLSESEIHLLQGVLSSIDGFVLKDKDSIWKTLWSFLTTVLT